MQSVPKYIFTKPPTLILASRVMAYTLFAEAEGEINFDCRKCWTSYKVINFMNFGGEAIFQNCNSHFTQNHKAISNSITSALKQWN